MSARRRSAVETLGAACVYAVGVPWVFRSWFPVPDTLPHAAGSLGAMIDADLYLNVWILAWVAHAVVTDPSQLLHGNIFHPALNTIAGSENMLAHVPFTAPVLALTGNAVTTLKAYVLESFVLSGVGMFLYVRHHTGNPWAALLAGAAFTFTPFRVDTVPQPQYLGIGFLPLAWLATDLHLETRRRRWLVGFAAALVLQALACVYVGYFAFLLCPVYVVARAWASRADGGAWRPTLRLAGATLVAALALLPVALPYLRAREVGMIPDHDLGGLVATSWPPWLFVSGEFVSRIGLVVALVLGLSGLAHLASWWRTGPLGDEEAPPRPNPHAALWLVVAAAALLAAGPSLEIGGSAIPLPYAALYEILPGFSSIRVPIRFLIVIAAALAALAGLTAGRWLRNAGSGRRSAVGLCLTALAIATAAPKPQSVLPARLVGESADVYRWLAEQPGSGAVLEIPGQSTEQDFVANLRNGRYMMASTLHWRPLLNGYTAYPPPSVGFYAAAIRELPDRHALATLRETSALRWILVHRDQMTPFEAARWPDDEVDGIDLVARFGATEVYEVEGGAGSATIAALRDRMRQRPADSLEGTARAPLPEECRRARIESAEIPDGLAALPMARRIPVRVRNQSACTWPARGFRKEGLVGLEFRWREPSGEAPQATSAFFRFLNDVEPGNAADGALLLTPPKGAPGDWELEVRLVQHGQAEPLTTLRRTVRVHTPRLRARVGAETPR